MLTWTNGRDLADTYTRKKDAEATLPGETSAGKQSATPSDECPNIVDPSDAAWEAAFPGQAILTNGCPNRPRLAMRWAQAMVRAAAIGDFVVAAICQRGMDRAYAPHQTKAGTS